MNKNKLTGANKLILSNKLLNFSKTNFKFFRQKLEILVKLIKIFYQKSDKIQIKININNNLF
jgi:hypothetical protein